jgi:O-antigen ligase
LLFGALMALLFAGWCAGYALNRCRIDRAVWRSGRWPLLALVLVQCWVSLQLVPLPSALLGALSPQALAWHGAGEGAPVSLDPAITRLHLYKGLAFSMAFFLTLALVSSRRRIKLLLLALLLSGTAQASYGALMALTGLEYGFFVEKYVGRGVATGTFVNANHLAGYLVMCIAAAIGLLLAETLGRESPAKTWRARLRHALHALLTSRLQLRICLALMVVALVLTRSRMGNIAFFSSLAFAGALAVVARGRMSWKAALFLAGLLLIDLFIVGQWFGLGEVMERIGAQDVLVNERADYALPLLQYLQTFPLTGSGGGSFYGIFPNFLEPSERTLPAHAHNDYLQFAVELGLPAAMLLGVAVIYCARAGWRAQVERHALIARGAGFTVVMVSVWAALHSLVDFNLQIPANVVTFVTLLALGPISRALR